MNTVDLSNTAHKTSHSRLKIYVRKLQYVIIFGLVLSGIGCTAFYSIDHVLLKKGAPVFVADASDQSEISFYALGDQGTGGYRQYITAVMMELSCQEDRDVDFSLLLGDNFYFEGVKSVTDKKFNDFFEEPYGGHCLSGMPFYAVLGNHDYKANPLAQVEYSRKNMGSGRWTMPGTTYIKDFGEVDGAPLIRLVVLDSQRPLDSQLALLKAAFSDEQQVAWKMVAAHLPIRSHSKKYGDNSRLVETLLPTLNSLGVHVYFSGHAHNLQLLQGAQEPVYVISGAAGKRPRKIADTNNPKLVYARESNGFVKVSVTKENLTLRFITLLSDSAFSISRHCITQRQQECTLGS